MSGVREGSVAERLSYDAIEGISHRTLAEKAFGVLHDAIVSGRLLPGERLPIADLAKATNMSPMPIREALHRLDGVGLVENVPHYGARVAGLSIDDLSEIYNARLLLEVPTVGHAAENFTEEDTKVATEWLEKLEAALQRDASDDVLEAHTGFHFALYGAASSRWLLRLISPLWNSAERYRVATIGVSLFFENRFDEHRELLAACQDREVEFAKVRLWNHLVRTANQVAIEMGAAEIFELKDMPNTSKSEPESS